MASSLIGSLRVALSLGTTEFEAGANKAASVARTKAKEIEGAFNGAKAAVAGLFAAFTVGLLTEQIKKSLDYAGSIAEVSRTLGVTTKDLQTFRYAATQTGVSQDQLELGLRRLTVSMGKAELGSKAQQKAFGALGITVADLKGKTTGDIFRMMSDSLSKVTDRSQRAAVEMTLMGRSGSTLDNLLAPGSRRLNELAEAAQRLGIVLSDSQIQGAEETAHKLAAVKEVLSAQIAGVVASNAQAILSLSSALATLTGSIVRFLGSNPQTALAIIGGLAGGALGARGGLLGAAAGAVVGATGGSYLGSLQSNANSDLSYRVQQMRSAQQDAIKAQNTPGVSNVTRTNTRDKFFEQLELLKKATSAFKAQQPAQPPPGVTLPQFLGGGGGKQKAAKKGPEDKTEQDEFQFEQQQRQIDLEILQAKRSLSHDVGDQAELSLQALALQHEIKDAEIDHKLAQARRDNQDGRLGDLALKQIEKDTAAEKLKEADLVALQRKAILDDRDQQLLQQSIELDQQGYDIMIGQLRKQADMADTADERLKIELQILELTYKWRGILDRRIIAENKDPLAVAHAQADLAALPKDHALDAQNTARQNQGPLGQYLQGLPTTADKWNAALQGVAVNGFGALETAIMSTLDGTKKLGAAFADMAKSIIADLIRISIQKAIIGPLAQGLSGMMGAGAAGAAGAGAAAGAMSASDAAFIGDTMDLMAFADGGFVSGRGGPTSDSIPAMLSNGEFVMNSGAVRSFGSPFFDAMNTGKIKPGDLTGGADHHGGGLDFLKYLSPAAMMFSAASKGGGLGFLKALSPLALVASKIFHFSEGGLVGTSLSIPRTNFAGATPALAGMGGGSGSGVVVHTTFNNYAKMSDSEARVTANQHASHLREAIAGANRRGF